MLDCYFLFELAPPLDWPHILRFPLHIHPTHLLSFRIPNFSCSSSLSEAVCSIVMFKPTVGRQIFKAINASHAALAATSRPTTGSFIRPLSYTATRATKKDDPKLDPNLAATTKAPEGASGEHEGQFARTDENVQIPYPPDSEMPAQPVVQGRGGMHFKRTLAQFSLENKVSMVTGGARGLGLVMAQALVASGSDLAIVDLNSMCCSYLN